MLTESADTCLGSVAADLPTLAVAVRMNMVAAITALTLLAISTQPWQETLDVAATPKASLENMYSTYVPYASVLNTTGFHAFLDAVAQPGANTSSPALLLNAHNAFALSLLANHACRHDLFGVCGVTTSVAHVGGWRHSYLHLHAGVLGGTRVSLADVQDRIRATVGVRAVAAAYLGTVSGPDLVPTAFDDAEIDAQLDASVLALLSNPTKGYALNRQGMAVVFARVLKWARNDLPQRDVIAFAVPYIAQVSPDDAAFLVQHKDALSISYFPYQPHIGGDLRPLCPQASSRPCFTSWMAGLVAASLVFLMAATFGTWWFIIRPRRCCWALGPRRYLPLDQQELEHLPLIN